MMAFNVGVHVFDDPTCHLLHHPSKLVHLRRSALAILDGQANDANPRAGVATCALAAAIRVGADLRCGRNAFADDPILTDTSLEALPANPCEAEGLGNALIYAHVVVSRHGDLSEMEFDTGRPMASGEKGSVERSLSRGTPREVGDCS